MSGDTKSGPMGFIDKGFELLRRIDEGAGKRVTAQFLLFGSFDVDLDQVCTQLDEVTNLLSDFRHTIRFERQWSGCRVGIVSHKLVPSGSYDGLNCGQDPGSGDNSFVDG